MTKPKIILQIAKSLKEYRFIQDSINFIENKAEVKEMKEMKKNV